MNTILCKKNLARSITWLDFNKSNQHFHIEHIEIESKNHRAM